MESDGIEDFLHLGIDLVQDPEELACLREVDFRETYLFRHFQGFLRRVFQVLDLQQQIQQVAQKQGQMTDKDMGFDTLCLD